MGLLDGIAGAIFQGAEGTAQQMLTQGVANAVPGGMQGLLSTLQSSGLEEHVASWLSDTTHIPISADQLTAALGDERVAQFAQSMGLDPQKAAEALAEHLPALAAAHQEQAAG